MFDIVIKGLKDVCEFHTRRKIKWIKIYLASCESVSKWVDEIVAVINWVMALCRFLLTFLVSFPFSFFGVTTEFNLIFPQEKRVNMNVLFKFFMIHEKNVIQNWTRGNMCIRVRSKYPWIGKKVTEKKATKIIIKRHLFLWYFSLARY